MQYFIPLLSLFASALAAPSPVAGAGTESVNGNVEARANVKYNCGGFSDASQRATINLVNELYARPPDGLVCRNNGPGKCSPFLSNPGSTLVLCNDRAMQHPYSKCIANRELADRTSNLVGRCGNGATVSGQIFAADRTNIIIHG
ncbi:hypothetical protein KC354_g17505 [Hortaea werneckii]|nr:hypothetical protein KC354_g17505 [Hortaea werneckii]